MKHVLLALCLSACGATSTYATAQTACLALQKIVLDRQATTYEQDRDDMMRVREACAPILQRIEESQP